MYYTTSLSRVIDGIFDGVPTNFLHNKAEIRNTQDGYAIDVLLPGFTKEEVEVKAEGKLLVIEAKTDRELPRYLHSKVKKTYEVEDINVDSIVAKLDMGLLRLTFSTRKDSMAKTVRVF